MAEDQETLEETQARLAAGSNTPYGPAADPVRPDPYAQPQTPLPSEPGTALDSPRRSRSVAVGIVAVAGVLAIGGFVAFFALDSGPVIDSDPNVEPSYSEEWQSFPGVSYIDPEVALSQASYEEVVAQSEVMMGQYREALTARFGLVWSQGYEPYSGPESNGYGGDSMLSYYDTGSWQGQVTLDDPSARQDVLDLFTELSTSYGGEGVLLRNDIYADDEVSSLDQFGAADLEDQALWSFFDSFPELAGLYLSSDVIDRSIPVDGSFTGDYSFVYDESSDTLYVTVIRVRRRAAQDRGPSGLRGRARTVRRRLHAVGWLHGRGL